MVSYWIDGWTDACWIGLTGLLVLFSFGWTQLSHEVCVRKKAIVTSLQRWIQYRRRLFIKSFISLHGETRDRQTDRGREGDISAAVEFCIVFDNLK